MRRLSLITIILLATVSVGHARDSIKDDYTSARPLLWTGLYLGAQVGAARGEWDYSNAISVPGIGPFAAPGFPLGEFGDRGLGAGLSAGFNQQFGRIVVGLEADINWADVESSRDFLAVGVGAGLPFTLDTSLEYYATLRARAGVIVNRWLLYATGGPAWASSKASITSPGQLAGPFATSDKNRHTGWTAGFGTEFLLDRHWIVGLEYKHIDLGRETYQFAFPLATSVTAASDLVIDEVTVRLKLKY